MNGHPPYYTDLLHRRFLEEAVLTPTEHRELDLHLLICPFCAYHYAQHLFNEDPQAARQILRDAERLLANGFAVPFLRELAESMQGGQPLDEFQQWLWWSLQHNREAMGNYRLLEVNSKCCTS